MKKCSSCKLNKDRDAFALNASRYDGLNNQCKDCMAEYRNKNRDSLLEKKRKHYSKNKQVAYEAALKRKYGITIEQFNDMLLAQGGTCAICKQPSHNRKMHVDHCHKTGAVRGILCAMCNTGIGALKDDPILMIRASEYVIYGGYENIHRRTPIRKTEIAGLRNETRVVEQRALAVVDPVLDENIRTLTSILNAA